MPVRRRVPKGRLELTPGQEAWLWGEKPKEGDVAFSSWIDFYFLSGAWESGHPGPIAVNLSTCYGEQVVAAHIEDFPGTRPGHWWEFTAPGPRRRCGGIGTPAHERLAHVLCLHLGGPMNWIWAEDLVLYEGL